MKLKLITLTIIISTFCFSVVETNAQTLSNRLKGKILLQVEQNGEAWYINPNNEKRYYMGRPTDAFNLMRELGLGVSEKDYNTYKDNNYTAPYRLAGKIILRVEANGEAYYINPVDNKLHYLGRPADAFSVMRNLGLGITDSNLKQISVARDVAVSIPTPTPVSVTQTPPEDLDIPCTYENGCEEYKGVEIWWKVHSLEEIFPYSLWIDGAYAESATMDVDYLLGVAKNAFDKYPEWVLEKYLKKAYIVDSFRISTGKVAGGTVSTADKAIYIYEGKYPDDFEQTFHHEFSSILNGWNYLDDYYNMNFDKKWYAINPEGFKYGEGMGGYFDEELAEQGFVSTYSTTNFTNDFNVIAQHIFRKETKFYGANFWEVVEEYPKIRQKLDLFISHYHKLDPIFTEEYFRSVWEK